MLVLSRRKDESIIIDDKIKVTIVEIRGDKIRLGISAAGSVPIHREEVWEAIHQDRFTVPAAAAKSPEVL